MKESVLKKATKQTCSFLSSLKEEPVPFPCPKVFWWWREPGWLIFSTWRGEGFLCMCCPWCACGGAGIRSELRGSTSRCPRGLPAAKAVRPSILPVCTRHVSDTRTPTHPVMGHHSHPSATSALPVWGREGNSGWKPETCGQDMPLICCRDHVGCPGAALSKGSAWGGTQLAEHTH